MMIGASLGVTFVLFGGTFLLFAIKLVMLEMPPDSTKEAANVTGETTNAGFGPNIEELWTVIGKTREMAVHL